MIIKALEDMNKFNFNRVKSLNNYSFMPNMASTLTGWESPLELVRINQDVVEGDLVTTEEKIQFLGVWQPLRNEVLELKPEGQRSWSWYWIHAKSGTLNLDTADKIIFNNVRYKVMEVKDYSLNGYIEYHVIKDYEGTDEEIS